MFNSRPVRIPKVERISLRDWQKGVLTAFDDGRTPTDALRGSANVVLDQDGTLRPRPSLVKYGSTAPGTILGEVFEFVKTLTGSSEQWEIAMINVGGVTRPYVRKDGGTWQATSGKTYNNTARAHFFQGDDKVGILNGEDTLSYLEISTVGTTNMITPFNQLATPNAPTLGANTGLTGTTFNVYYRVSANSTIGETDASAKLTVPVLIPRDQWNKDTQSIRIQWTAVAGARDYNVYQGDVDGTEFLIASGINGLTYTDNGTAQRDVTRLAPVFNSTAGMKGTRGAVINGQIFIVGDKDNPRYVWNGGYAGHIFDFSPTYGGGNTEIGTGTKEFPVRVMPFRDGRGNNRITVLCRGTNGRGKRYIMSANSITVGEITIDFFDVEEDNGQDGTDSPDGVILYNDSLWYPSRDGFKTTGTKPQLQNILSTDRVSNTIQPDIKNLNNAAMGRCVGLGFEGRLYWALPVGGSTNTQIWTLDLERQGAWMKPWTIAADWMWLYNDNQGKTHHCVLVNNEIYEMTYEQATSDNGVAFPTSATSGIIKFSEDGQEWGKIIDVTFVLLRPQGNITLSVSGKTEDSGLTTIGSQTYNPETSISGWSEGAWEMYEGWADSNTVPTSFGDARAAVVIEVDETLNWWKWELSTRDSGVDYQLSDVICRFVRVGLIDQT